MIPVVGDRPEQTPTSSDSGTTSGSDNFEALYDVNAEPILRYFYRRTACPETSADLTAETFAAALVSWQSYEPAKGSARAWLFGIAHHQLTRYHRWQRIDTRARSRLGMQRHVDLDDESRHRIEELESLKGLMGKVAEAKQRLSPKLAEAVRLRVELELPFSEVARRLGCSEQAARARVSRALGQLAREMESH
jgi:RNA polymerase sigma-70 factor (ECF subfamily)